MYYISLFSAFAFILLAIGNSQGCECGGYSLSCSIDTSSGTVNGLCNDVNGVNRYYGIPYARPPVGKLRFSMPIEYNGGNSTPIDATKQPPACPQNRNTTSIYSSPQLDEDCLFLNIFAPRSRSRTRSSSSSSCSDGGRIPVMIWIHGGSFGHGYSAEPQLDGTKLAGSQNIIVITINYRLGILGWGFGKNYGMADVIQALKWTQQNIEQFGGDPGQVTIAGQSSGGTMVRYLLNSPKASGLFHRAIIHSDPMALPAFNQSVAIDVTGQASGNLGCYDNSTQCLQNTSIDELVQAQGEVTQSQNINYDFGPTIDGDLIPEDTATAVSKGRFANQVDILYGTVSDELGPTVAQTSGPDLTSFQSQFAVDSLLPSASQFYKTEWQLKLDQSKPPYQQLIDLGTLTMFECSSRSLMDSLASATRVFNFKFNMGIHNPHNSDWYCQRAGVVCHEDDIIVLFGTYPANTTVTVQELMSVEVQQRWAGFMKSGDPNNGGNFVQWDPVSNNSTTTAPYVLLINGTGSVNRMSHSDDSDKCTAIMTNITL